MIRRLSLVLTALGVAGAIAVVAGGSCVFRKLGGDFKRPPSAAKTDLSAGARQLVVRAYRGLETGPVTDYHVHAVALGTHVEGAYVHEGMTSWSSPTRYFKYLVYMSASGVDDESQADTQYLARLTELAQGLPVPVRHHLLAFDEHVLEDGTVDREKTEFHTPNEYVFEVAAHHPELFVPVMSVHPHREDALEQLEQWAARGGRMVKWLPNAMGIDPLDPRHDAYYDTMKRLGLVLLTHAGEEQAVESEEEQQLGNPLRLRRPLDRGVKVIVAHAASLGESVDLDDPDGSRVPSFDLFLRLMDEERYRGLLFGEISAIGQFNRVGKPLATLIAREELHPRLVNGSDYPLPAINALFHVSDFVSAGYITEEEGRHLREIYGFNPLLFDFVLKRSLKNPETGRGFADSVFLANPGLEG